MAFNSYNRCTNFDFEIVFVTAYDQYGIQAVKWSALDYLIKAH